MTGTLDRIEARAAVWMRHEQMMVTVNRGLAQDIDALVEVAKAAQGVRRYARRVDLDFAASKGYDLDAALARLEDNQ